MVKLSGRVVVLPVIDPALWRLIRQVEPQMKTTGAVYPVQGLTGLTQQWRCGERRLLVRRQPAPREALPGIDRQREFRLLRKLAQRGVVAAPLAFRSPWLLLRWLDGETPAAAAWQAQRGTLLQLVVRLHQLPPLGYRLNMTALLWRYWQLSAPHQRQPFWLKRLKTLTQRGEPEPLRLAPLHLDIHRENSVQSATGLQLIDWEYSADGDVALELALLQYGAVVDVAHWSVWRRQYAQAMLLNESLLAQQIVRWRPWVQLLIASWYTLRNQQIPDTTLAERAEAAWCRLKAG